jgi:hypothetical protein
MLIPTSDSAYPLARGEHQELDQGNHSRTRTLDSLKMKEGNAAGLSKGVGPYGAVMINSAQGRKWCGGSEGW